MPFRIQTGFTSLIFMLCINTVLASEPYADGFKAYAPYFHISGTDSGIDQLPLKNNRTEIVISGVIAEVIITQTYENMGNAPINARYIFPGSLHSAVTGMTMKTGDRVTHARIREKDAARNIFNAARSAGKQASLLEQQRPNVFSTDVANIMPGDAIEIELRYTELLIAENGTYEFVLPGVVGPRYGGRDSATDPDQAWIANPYLQAKVPAAVDQEFSLQINSPVPIQELKSATHAMRTYWNSSTSATLMYDTAETDPGNRDFILEYRLRQGEIISGLMQFEGEDENYFLLLAEPPDRVIPEQIPPREYIFVVDVSGSMSGFPLDVTKSMLRGLVTGLEADDTFNLLFFAGASSLLAPASLPASPQNLQLALTMLDQQRGGGGTELLQAMTRALDLPADEGRARTIVILTDGYISAERDVFSKIHQSLGKANIFAFGIGTSVNRYLIEGIARAGNGETFIATSKVDVQRLAQRFIEYIEAPVLTDIGITAQNVTLYDIEPSAFSDLLAQRPVQVFGKYRDQGKDARITLEGITGTGKYEQSIAFNTGAQSTGNRPLQWLWARKRISALADYHGRNVEENRPEITELGLKYSLLTQYTSFVAVDEVVRNTGLAASNVKQPLALPAGVSNLAVSGQRNVAEPGLAMMALALSLMLLMYKVPGRWISRR